MIQPLPLDGCPVPFPGVPIDPHVAELFAALLAGKVALPQAVFPDALPAKSENHPKAESNLKLQSEQLGPCLPWLDVSTLEWRPAATPRSSSPGSPEITDAFGPDLPAASRDRAWVTVPYSQPVRPTAQPGLRTLELLVAPEILASSTPVDLSTTFQLPKAPTLSPLPSAAPALEIRALPARVRETIDVAVNRTEAARRHAPVSHEDQAAHRWVEEKAHPGARPSNFASHTPAPIRTERSRSQRPHSQPDFDTRHEGPETLRGRGERLKARPLAIHREFVPSTSTESQRSLPNQTDLSEGLPDRREVTLPTQTVTRDPIPVPVQVERPVLLERSNDGTQVRFVLEDWTPNAPVRSIRISLEPRELGSLNVTLLHRNGQVHARVVVENAQALHLVQTQAAALQRSLAEQGMNFGSFSVTLASNAAWTGLPAGGALRTASGDPERKEDIQPRRKGRNEVKTT